MSVLIKAKCLFIHNFFVGSHTIASCISSAAHVPTAVVRDVQNTEAAASATSSCLQITATMQVHKLATATDFALLFIFVRNVIFYPRFLYQ